MGVKEMNKETTVMMNMVMASGPMNSPTRVFITANRKIATYSVPTRHGYGDKRLLGSGEQPHLDRRKHQPA